MAKLIVVSGCSGAVPSNSHNAEPSAQSVIGSRGGAISLDDGTKLDIPEGALPDDVEISVRPSSRSIGDALGPAYVFEPDGLQFDRPIKIRLPFDKDDARALASVDVFTAPGEEDGDGEFTRLNGLPAGEGFVEAETTHFSIYVAGGGTVSSIAIGENYPHDLAVSKGRVYWTSGGSSAKPLARGDGVVASASTTGGPIKVLTPTQKDPRNLVVAGSTVYFTNGGAEAAADGGTTGSALLAVPTGGGTPTTLAAGLGFANDVVAGDNRLFFTDLDLGTVGSVASVWGAMATVASGVARPSFLARSGGQLFFTARADGTVRRAPEVGGEAPVTLATGQGEPLGIATDASNVYWVNFGDGRVMKASTAGGKPVKLAAGLSKPNAIAVSDTDVYFTCIGDGTVRWVSSTGGPVKILAHEQPSPVSIAVDGDYLYWANNGAIDFGGSVVRMAR